MLAWLSVRAGVMLALRACGRGSARVRAWLCAVPAQLCVRACLALCARRRSSARAPALEPCGPCDSTCLQLTMSYAPLPSSSLSSSPSLSSTPFSPSSLLCQVRGCCHIMCPTGPLVRAFQRCRLSSSFRCWIDIARCRRRAEPAGGQRRAGLAVSRGRAGPAQRPCCCWFGPRLPTRLLETVVNGWPRNLIPKSPAQITVLSSPK